MTDKMYTQSEVDALVASKLREADEITNQIGLQYLNKGKKAGWGACDDAGHKIRDIIPANYAADLERIKNQARLEEHIKICRIGSWNKTHSHPCGCLCGCETKCSRRVELEAALRAAMEVKK